MSANDALADLGLDFGADNASPTTPEAATDAAKEAIAQETVANTAPVTESDTSEEKRTFTTVKISDEDIDIDEEGSTLPPLERKGFGGGGRQGSKYPFEKLNAPTGEGDQRRYTSFTIRVPEGEDYERVRRSVQSAATNANSQAKTAGLPNYYVTRQFNNDKGEAVGIRVFRTDERPADAKAE